jgi:hypothetical protein
VADTDGAAVLTFDQAQERARAWFEEMATGDLASRRRGPYTIANCMRDYLDWAKQHRKSISRRISELSFSRSWAMWMPRN